MDSGNSGSMQSSSGGDEEYDSRSESISSFLNSSAHFGSISEPPQQQQPPPLLAHQPTLFGHPHSQNLDAFPQSLANPSGSNTQYAHDVLWSRGLRSDPSNYANFGNITALSSSSAASSVSSSAQSVLNVQGLNQPLPPHSSIDANNAAKASVLQSDHQPNPVKNPKKRTRASRRAPTTVLTTDTTNFRQMVQEFTGIPTAPFSAGSPYSRRLDLFSTGTSNLRSGSHLDALGPLYPLRPAAQKVQLSQSSLMNSSAMIDSLVSSTTNSGNTVMMPSQNILNMQNQMLSFQGNNNSTTTTNNNNNNTSIPSFLQLPSLKHHTSSSSSAMLTGKSSQGINASIPSFDELGLGHHENVNVNASLNSAVLFPISSERWRDGGGAAAAALSDHHNMGSSSFDGGNKPLHLSNNYSKFNCSTSTSEFLHHDKGLENVTSGGEGTVAPWICPSD